MKKVGVFTIAGLVIIGWLVVASPFGPSRQSDFGSILSTWGERQEEASDEITSFAVAGAEGKYVDEHQVNGANWSIPNIIRYWIGVKK